MLNGIKLGFSLIELMVVIAIVAVLAAVAVPAYMGYIERSKMNAVYTSISQQIDLWTDVNATGDWYSWDVADRYRPTPPIQGINGVYVNWDNIVFTFEPGYYNRDATTYVAYYPSPDGQDISGFANANDALGNAKVISWVCVVSGIDGAYDGYTVLEFQQTYFPQCSCSGC